MRIAGTLTKWNDDRGFGFITPANGGPEVFVHISAFTKDGRRPTIGERLTFEIETDGACKKRAKNVLCPDRSATRAVRHLAPRLHKEEKRSLLGRIAPLFVVIALASYGYDKYAHRAAPLPAASSVSADQTAPSPFHCDGRTHCSQMTSCAEATYFLSNCPNVRMDGNHDGVPCEQQWCTGSFAR